MICTETPENGGMAGAFTPLSFRKGTTGAELPFHRCRSRQILAVQKMFARISPNLPVNFLCNFSLQILSHKDHEDLFWCDLQKRSSCVFMQTLGAIFWSQATLGAIFLDFQGFFPDFHQIKAYGGALAPHLQQHCFS